MGILELLMKGEKDNSPQRRGNPAAARRKLKEGIRNLKAGKGEDAFEDFAAVKYYLRGEECYTESLLSQLDKLLDAAWRMMNGKDRKVGDVDSIAKKIERLMEQPKGEKASPPVRVKTVRDMRLWEAAKRIVQDNYKEVEEDSERYWALVSRIFTRMKLRLGGLQEKAVEKIVRELQEKKGKLPPAGEGSKSVKEIEEMKLKEMKEQVKQLLLKCLLEQVGRK